MAPVLRDVCNANHKLMCVCGTEVCVQVCLCGVPSPEMSVMRTAVIVRV